MADFKTHVTLSSTVMAFLTVYTVGNINTYESLFVLLIGVFAAILPDIDSDHSKSIKIVFTILTILSCFIYYIFYWTETSSIYFFIGLTIICVLLNTIILKIFQKLTVHRGIFHSIPMAVFLALIILIFMDWLSISEKFTTFVFISFGIGYLSHLILDEIFSVNLSGVRIKRSFGTALKFFDTSQNFLYILIYLLIFGLIFFTEHQKYIKIFQHELIL